MTEDMPERMSEKNVRKIVRKKICQKDPQSSSWPGRTPNSRSQWSPLDTNREKGRGGEDNSGV